MLKSLMNAAGYAKRVEHVQKLAYSGVNEITVGSITVEKRMGNAGRVFECSKSGSINALGLPNPGLSYYHEHLCQMVAIAHSQAKTLRASIAGFTVDEYALLARQAAKSGVDSIEVNLGCPNVWKDSQQKPIASYDPALVEEIIVSLEPELEGWHGTLALKSSWLEPMLLKRFASAVNKYPFVNQVVVMNTVANGLIFGALTHYPVIDPDYGGLAGGEFFKWMALGQIKQFRAELNPEVEIVGVGGIRTGLDVFEHLKAGAQSVQVGSAFFENEDVRIFTDIGEQYASYLDEEQ